jgi:putative Holliday junction resolvase
MPEAEHALLGFDFGLKRIGVAIGQTITRSASPLKTIACPKGAPDWPEIAALISEWRPDALVVGMPSRPDDSEHEMHAPIERFMRQLRHRFKLPVHVIDERLSSVEAAERLRANKNGGSGLDAQAAQVILETFLAS